MESTSIKERLLSRHHAWIAQSRGEVIAALGLALHETPVAHLLWLGGAPSSDTDRLLARSLVEAATAHARDQGCLKLIVHASLTESQVGFFEQLGFVFSRQRGVGPDRVLEFYLDLYRRLERNCGGAHSAGPAAAEGVRVCPPETSSLS